MQFKKPEFSKAARLKRASTIWELREIAKRRTPAGTLRLHGRRRRSRNHPPPRPRGVPGHRVPARDPAGCLQHRPEHRHPGQAFPAPGGHRPHRLHPDDAVRRRVRRLPGRRSRWHSLHALHHGHGVHRGRCRGRTHRPQLVPAVPVDGPGPLARADRARRQGRQRYPHGHGGHRRRGRPPPGRPQRHDYPAGADAQDRAGCVLPPGLVVQLPHPRAADVRVAVPLHGHGRGPDQLHVRPHADLRGPRLAARDLEGQARGQGHPDGRRRPQGGGPRRRRDRALQPRRPPAGPGTDPVPPAPRGLCSASRRTTARRRSSWTPAS